ncbi:MAG TPA: hypothetical protein VG711_10230 [Phycisphaerales bacterium]|nr:hypothetical protein [Phycisphaerales bacterium]
MNIRDVKRISVVAAGVALTLCVVIRAESIGELNGPARMDGAELPLDEGNMESSVLSRVHSDPEERMTENTHEAKLVAMYEPTNRVIDEELPSDDSVKAMGERGLGALNMGMSVIGAPPAVALGGMGLIMAMFMRRRWDPSKSARTSFAQTIR